MFFTQDTKKETREHIFLWFQDELFSNVIPLLVSLRVSMCVVDITWSLNGK